MLQTEKIARNIAKYEAPFLPAALRVPMSIKYEDTSDEAFEQWWLSSHMGYDLHSELTAWQECRRRERLRTLRLISLLEEWVQRADIRGWNYGDLLQETRTELDSRTDK